MRSRTLPVLLLAGMLLLTTVQAHLSATATAPSEAIGPGETFTFTVDLSYTCAEFALDVNTDDPAASEGIVTERSYSLTAAEAGGDYAWMTAEAQDVTLDGADCLDDPSGAAEGHADIPVTLGLGAPAGIYALNVLDTSGKEVGADAATFAIRYNPAFVFAGATDFDSDGTLTEAVLDFTVGANADSTMTFEARDVPAGFQVHAAPVKVTAPYQDGLETRTVQVPVHFGVGEDAMAGMEGMDDGSMDTMDAADALDDHAHWESVTFTLRATIGADGHNATKVLDIPLTFTNTDADSLPHDDAMDGMEDNTTSEDEGFLGLPGPGVALVLPALAGAVLLARRRD